MHRLLLCLLVVTTALVFAVPACKTETDPTQSGGAGGVGGEGGCPSEPGPQFTITLSAMEGAVPDDTSVEVSWSAGQEPEFVVGDPKTHATLDDGANVECKNVLATGAGGSADVESVVCELWTVGPTQVIVHAAGHVPIDETLVPQLVEDCVMPRQEEVAIELLLDLDAGMR